MAATHSSRQVGRLILSHSVDDIRETILRALDLLRTAISNLGLRTVAEWLATLPLGVLRFVLTLCKSITAIPFGIVNLLRYVLDMKVQRSVLRPQPRSIGTGGHTAVSFLSGLFRLDFDFHLQLGLPFHRKASRFQLATNTTPVHTVVLGGVRTVGSRPYGSNYIISGTASADRRVTAPAGPSTTHTTEPDRDAGQVVEQPARSRQSTEITPADESPSSSRSPANTHTPTRPRTPSPYPTFPQGFTPVPERPHYHVPAEPARWPPASRAWPMHVPATSRSPRHCCPDSPPRTPTGPLSLPPPSSPPDSTCSLPTISTHRATTFSTPCSSPHRSPRVNTLLPAIVNSPGLRASPAKPVAQGGCSFGLQLLLDAEGVWH